MSKPPPRVISESTLKEVLQRATGASARERIALAKQGGYLAKEYLKEKDLGVEQLRLCEELLRLATRHHAFPGEYAAALSRATSRRLDKSGAANAEIRAKAAATVTLEAAAVLLADRDMIADAGALGGETDLVAAVNEGRCFAFGTGADGPTKLELRLVAAAEPVLAAKEYKKLSAASATGGVVVRSGQLGAGDLFAPATLNLAVPEGAYAVCAHLLGNGTYVIVLSATPEPPRSELRSIEVLEG